MCFVGVSSFCAFGFSLCTSNGHFIKNLILRMRIMIMVYCK